MAPGKGDGGMPNDEPDDNIAHDAEKWLLRKQAQLMLDLFAEDCGRMPVILDEVREWARSQDERYLQFRVNHRLNVFLETYENTSASGAVTPGGGSGQRVVRAAARRYPCSASGPGSFASDSRSPGP